MNRAEMPGWLRGSEMGELILDHDWTGSGLGPVSTWPPNLKFAVSTILLMPSAALLLWGPRHIQIYNDSYRDMMGVKHPGGLGQAVSDCWPEAWNFFSPICEAVVQRRESFVFDDEPLVVNRTGTPEEASFRLTYSPIPDDIDSLSSSASNTGRAQAGGAPGIFVTVSETTETINERAWEAERARLKTESRFRDALEIDTVGVIFLDKDAKITEANDAFLEMSGFSREDEQAGLLRCDELTPPEWMATTLRAGEELKATGRATPYEKEIFRKDGSRWWALIAAMQLNEMEGVLYVINITERKRAEQNLRESEARFRAMAEASPALTWQVNAQGDLVYVNQRVMDMVGMTLEELSPSRWRSVLHSDDEPGYMAAFEQALRDRSRFQHRVRARARGGEWHWLESYALPWFIGPDEHAGHVGVSIDITEAVKAETALREADLRKDEFLATLAHELRNPLAPIANALAIIAHPEGAAAVPHLLPVINRQVNYMIRLVDDLLEISRITSGKVELRQAPVDLATILHNAVEGGRPRIDEKEHKLSVSIPEEPLIVYADAVRLEQVFTNLLNNAARYTGKRGQIWLTAHREADNAVVSIRDNGIGILPGMLPRLFDMFTQERRNGVGTQEGLGIGLSLVYRLVKMHGGTVEARSEGKDRGSEFIVRLPLAASVIQGEMMEPEKAAAAPTGLRVLVVDDNHDAAEVLSMLLESMGLDVHSVDSGPAALAAIPEYRPNIILMDIGMPGMDGNEVARRIREQPQFNDIKLIALTGWGQEKDRRLSHESGFDYHLTKPVNFKVLKGLIDAF